jgi:hypothetical protein
VAVQTYRVAVAHRKRGQGKTTTTYYLGRELAERGRRVVLRDVELRVDAPDGALALLASGGPVLTPDGRTLGAVFFRADGYHVGVAPFDSVREAAARAEPTPPESRPASAMPPVARDTGRVRRYNPWPSLLPRYWLPLYEAGLGAGYRVGAMTSGADLVGRHAYAAQLLVPTDATGVVGELDYRYAGLGQPIVGLSVSQNWELWASGPGVDIHRGTRDALLYTTFVRPRARTYAALTVGGGLETTRFAVDPPDARASLRPELQQALADSAYPRVFVSGSWGNPRQSAYAVSPEDGVTLAATVDQRWAGGTSGVPTRRYVGVTTGYKSLDLPGFARHVVAARLAGGIADRQATDALEVGGVSGGTLSLLPGYVVGTGQRAFPVRGFDAASLAGTRAVAASLEYRAPLVIPARGLRLLPFFLDRTALSLFYDAGAAWCDRPTDSNSLCGPSGVDGRWLASVGAELNVVAAVLSWDAPYRFRLGAARPVSRPVPAPDVTWYAAIGLSF